MDELEKTLIRNDWGEIVELSKRKVFQRKFQIIEAYISLVSQCGIHRVTHAEISKKCKASRQLIDHHFPDDEQLLLLSYRYFYARFQKLGADAIGARAAPHAQLKAYIDMIIRWVDEKRQDAKFLSQIYPLAAVYPALGEAHERNMHIGQERIAAMILKLKVDPKRGPNKLDKSAFTGIARSVQKQLLGYVVLAAISPKPESAPDRQELWRCVASIIGIAN